MRDLAVGLNENRIYIVARAGTRGKSSVYATVRVEPFNIRATGAAV